MRKYIQAKIKVVELNSEQAVLEACNLGGAYFNAEGNCVRVVANPYVNYRCYVSVKERTFLNGMPTGNTPDAQPS